MVCLTGYGEPDIFIFKNYEVEIMWIRLICFYCTSVSVHQR
jgi:hypothetical protein